MKGLGLLLVFAGTFSVAQSAPTQFTQIPPKPTCNVGALPLFGGGPDCQDRWNIYNQAVQQRAREEVMAYVNRQKDIAASQASAPLQQQIADLNKLSTDQQAQIKRLGEQIQADAAASLQAKAEAHTEGVKQGAGFGAGGVLMLIGLIFGIRKLSQDFSVTKKSQAKAASA